MKKGRHRRFEEARALKRSTEVIVEPCAECGAEPGADHASWCLAMEDEMDGEEEEPNEEPVVEAKPGLYGSDPPEAWSDRSANGAG